MCGPGGLESRPTKPPVAYGMNPRVRRIVIPLVVAASAVGLIVLAFSSQRRTTPSQQQAAEQVETADAESVDAPEITDATQIDAE